MRRQLLEVQGRELPLSTGGFHEEARNADHGGHLTPSAPSTARLLVPCSSSKEEEEEEESGRGLGPCQTMLSLLQAKSQ